MRGAGTKAPLLPIAMRPRLLRRLCSSYAPRPTLKAAPGCDLPSESTEEKATSQSVSVREQKTPKVEKEEEAPTSSKPDKDMSVIFTCNICKTRTQKFFSKVAYTHGIVIVRCPSCQSLHLIADNLGWIKDKKPWRIGDQKYLLREASVLNEGEPKKEE